MSCSALATQTIKSRRHQRSQACSLPLHKRTTSPPLPSSAVVSPRYAMLVMCFSSLRHGCSGQPGRAARQVPPAAAIHIPHRSRERSMLGLKFQLDDLSLAGFAAYSDSDQGACPSTTGYTFILTYCAVSWLSRLCLCYCLFNQSGTLRVTL